MSPNWQGSAPKTKFADIMIDVGTYPTICDRIDGVSRKSKPQSDRLLGLGGPTKGKAAAP